MGGESHRRLVKYCSVVFFSWPILVSHDRRMFPGGLGEFPASTASLSITGFFSPLLLWTASAAERET